MRTLFFSFIMASLQILNASDFSAGEQSLTPQQKTYPNQRNPGNQAYYSLHFTTDLGFSYAHMNLSPQGVASSSGNSYGVQFNAERKLKDAFYGGVQFTWRMGSFQNSSSNRTLQDFDVQERIGYAFGTRFSSWTITPFSGFGWRYLGENLSQTDQATLGLYYNEVYVPVGVLCDYAVNDWFSWGIYGTWLPQVFPTVNLDPLGGARWIVERTLTNGRVEMPFIFKFCYRGNRLGINLKPYFEVWHDGATIAKTSPGRVSLATCPCIISSISLGLPENRYFFYGVNASLQYEF